VKSGPEVRRAIVSYTSSTLAHPTNLRKHAAAKPQRAVDDRRSVSKDSWLPMESIHKLKSEYLVRGQTDDGHRHPMPENYRRLLHM
jgi:hypothetical protein